MGPRLKGAEIALRFRKEKEGDGSLPAWLRIASVPLDQHAFLVQVLREHILFLVEQFNIFHRC